MQYYTTLPEVSTSHYTTQRGKKKKNKDSEISFLLISVYVIYARMWQKSKVTKEGDNDLEEQISKLRIRMIFHQNTVNIWNLKWFLTRRYEFLLSNSKR